MIKECSGVRLHLSALPSESSGSTKTHLEMEHDGQRQEVAAPPEMADYTAVGLGCAEDAKGGASLSSSTASFLRLRILRMVLPV